MAKLFLSEPGWREVRLVWESETALVSSRVCYPETCAALAAARRARRIGARRAAAAFRELERVWPQLHVLEVDADVGRLAGVLASSRGLSALDALHLASALRLEEPETVMLTFDGQLRAAAAAEGLAVAP